MRRARVVLILTGLAFRIWEAVDVFWIDVPAVAAVFAVEAASAPAWAHVMTVTKVVGFTLGVIGLLAALAAGWQSRQRGREAAAVATSRGYVPSAL